MVDDLSLYNYRLPSVKNGVESCVDPELEVRKLYRVSANYEFFENQCRHPAIVTIMNQLLGNNVKLLQSMTLLKPPGRHCSCTLYPSSLYNVPVHCIV